MQYSYKFLSRCTNESLNRLGVRTATPKMLNDTRNNCVVWHPFIAFAQNITHNNSGESLKGAGRNGVVIGLVAILFALFW